MVERSMVPIRNGQFPSGMVSGAKRSEAECSGADHSRRELTIPDGNPCGARPYPRGTLFPSRMVGFLGI